MRKTLKGLKYEENKYEYKMKGENIIIEQTV